MSRIKKRGLDYFPLNTDFIYDRLVRRIMKREGDGAFTTLLGALSCIYADEGYYVPVDELFYEDLAAWLYEKSAGDVKRILALAVEYGIFDATLFNEYNILTSAEIQRQYLFSTKRRKSSAIDTRYCLIDDASASEDTDNPEDEAKHKASEIGRSETFEARSGEALEVKSSETPGGCGNDVPYAHNSKVSEAGSSETPEASRSEAPEARSSETPGGCGKNTPYIPNSKVSEAGSGETSETSRSEAPEVRSSETPGGCGNDIPYAHNSKTLKDSRNDAPKVGNSETPEVRSSETPGTCGDNALYTHNSGTLKVSKSDAPEVGNSETPEIRSSKTPGTCGDNALYTHNSGTLKVNRSDTPEVGNSETPEVRSSETPEVVNSKAFESRNGVLGENVWGSNNVTFKPENATSGTHSIAQNSIAQNSIAQNSINPPLLNSSPTGGTEDADKTSAEEKYLQKIADMQPPHDGTSRNFDGLLYSLRQFRIPPHEQYAIILKSNFGAIGHPLWKGFYALRESHGKIRLPGRYLLSLCR